MKILNVSRNNILNVIKICFFIIKYCNENSISIIHSHHRYFDLIAYVVSKVLEIRTVTTVHSKVYGKKILSYKADKLIAVSESVENI